MLSSFDRVSVASINSELIEKSYKKTANADDPNFNWNGSIRDSDAYSDLKVIAENLMDFWMPYRVQVQVQVQRNRFRERLKTLKLPKLNVKINLTLAKLRKIFTILII